MLFSLKKFNVLFTFVVFFIFQLSKHIYKFLYWCAENSLFLQTSLSLLGRHLKETIQKFIKHYLNKPSS